MSSRRVAVPCAGQAGCIRTEGGWETRTIKIKDFIGGLWEFGYLVINKLF